MTSWIRWWGLALFAAIALLWWLFIDSTVKAAIEFAGTEAMGAKVELDSAAITLIPTSLTLRGLQVTNPEQPMQNLIAGDTITLELDALRLLRRQLFADQLNADGLSFYSPRSESGAIAHRALSKEGAFNPDNFKLPKSLPGITLPDSDALIAAEKQHLKNEVNSIKGNLDALEQQWDQRIAKLPNKENVAEYKSRWEALKKANWAEKLQGISALQKDVQRDLDSIGKLDKQLDQDLKTVQRELNRAKTLPEREADRLLAKVGLNTTSRGITEALFSGGLEPLLQQAMSLLDRLPATDSTPQPEKPARGKGQWVHFNEQPAPDILIRNASLSGTVSVGGKPLRFDGKGSDLTHQPQRWNQPAKLTINGTGEQNGSLALNALLDHRDKNINRLALNANNITLLNLPLSNNEKLNIALNKALGDLVANLALEDGQLTINANTHLRNVALAVNAMEQTTTTKAIIDVLQSVTDFNLTLAVNGTLAKPTVTISSDLDNLLSQAIGAQVRQQAQKLQGKLQQQISEAISPEMQALLQQGEQLRGVENLLAERRNQLQVLSKGLL